MGTRDQWRLYMCILNIRSLKEKDEKIKIKRVTMKKKNKKDEDIKNKIEDIIAQNKINC